MPNLTLLRLSDSLAAMWPTLATECGLDLVTLSEAAAFDRLTNTVGVVSGAGAEAELESTFLRIVGGSIEIAAVGTHADHRLASAVVRAGAAQYFALPEDLDLLRSWIRERGERLNTLAKRQAFAHGEGAKYRFEGILGGSASLRAALDRAGRVIPHANVTVLISGETGTGKELLARAIHYNGPRREAPFVDINCAAIPAQLLESELFGHEKGAFTDATSAKPGLFELANGGTLFLDEIGHLALPLQGKLLRALEERQIRRVGGSRSLPIDVRVLAASHIDLAAAVKRGEFREDLFYRLNVVPIELPPLRARRDDIVPLARHFLARFANEYGLPAPALSAAAERALRERSWPGNVRELRNTLERALVLGTGESLEAGDLAEEAPRGGDPHGIPFPATLAAITRSAALATLAYTAGNKSEAARQLGISRPRLQRLLDATDDDSPALSEDSDA